MALGAEKACCPGSSCLLTETCSCCALTLRLSYVDRNLPVGWVFRVAHICAAVLGTLYSTALRCSILVAVLSFVAYGLRIAQEVG